MAMKNPPHPGELVKYECLDALGLTVTKGAEILRVSRQALSNLINGHSDISPDMAIRLEKAFGSTAETWLKMQLAYNLAQAHKRAGSIDVKRYEMA
jgi:addiction module HigA family antidote